MSHSRFGPPRAALVTALMLIAVSALVVSGWERPAVGGGPRSGAVTLWQLKVGLGCWESGGRYDARNSTSGAYGKYQIMPANWMSWAKRYVGRGSAKQTAANQEQVASGKLRGLQAWLKSWDRVLYWWLTGATGRDRTQWSDTATRYVSGILSMANRAATAKGRRTIPRSCLSTPAAPGPSGGGNGPAHKTVHRRVIVPSLHVRAGAGSVHAPLGFVHKGDILAVMGRAHDAHGRTWVRISRRGSPQGWVARWFTILIR